MSLSAFDKDIAKKMMDKDSDGKCDACGMPVEMCMDSGQMQCNMDSKSTIGILGSQHIHANFSIVIDGSQTDVSKLPSMASSFIHTDGEPKLHMHATGVPLWIFFESIGMASDSKDIKIMINSKPSEDGLNYVFSDGDDIEVYVPSLA